MEPSAPFAPADHELFVDSVTPSAPVAPLNVTNNDARKAELQALVHAGKLSEEEAYAIAQKIGLIAVPKVERTSSLSKSTQLFNFSVYKWSKGRTVQRLILQFDFQSQTLSCIQHGTRTKKLEFKEVEAYQSEDGLRLTIQFCSQEGEYELDADTQEDKNSMCRLLQAVVRQKAENFNFEESLHYHEYRQEPESVEEVPESSNYPLEKEIYKKDDYVQQHIPSRAIKRVKLTPSLVDLPSTKTPSSLGTGKPIKEGLVEKKGHSVAFLMWPKRYLKVWNGELLYYKPEDTLNALNIIPLNSDVIEVKKNGYNVFTVGLTGKDKVFSFRTIGNSEKTAQQLRDEWYQAILDGCRYRRNSAAGLRRGTVTAKELMHEKSKQMPGALEKFKQSFRKQGSLSGGGEELPLESPGRGVEVRRSLTMSGPLTRKRSSKRNSLTEEILLSPSRRATFYEHEDVTRPVSRPADFAPLHLQGKKMDQVLKLLKPEFEELCKILRPMTTGSSQADMLVMRVSSIISALWELYAEETGETLTNDLEVVGSPLLSPPGSLLEQDSSNPSIMEESYETRSGSRSRHNSTSEKGSLTAQSGLQTSCSPDDISTEKVYAIGDSPERDCSGPHMQNVMKLASDDGEKEPEAVLVKAVSSSPNHSSGEQLFPPIISTTELPPPPPPSTAAPPGSVDALPPPPPLPGLGGGVPPPPPIPGYFGAVPPPPPMPGLPGGPPPPPPMPGVGMDLFSSLLPRRTLPKPSMKMRKFHWTPLSQQSVIQSGWMDWSGKDVTDVLDLKQLEELFGQDSESRPKTPALAKKTELKTLLDQTRARNIEIFLPSFPISLEQLTADSLGECLNCLSEDSILKLDHIVALKRFQPTDEEKEMYKNYLEDKTKLQNADSFLLKLCDVPLLSKRLDLLFTIREFPANFEGFQPSLDLAWKASRELKEYKGFIEVLQFVLAMGNYLNDGSRQGGAYGFKLATLPKLAECCGQDRKVSLLHYLIHQLHSHRPVLLQLPQEMQHTAKASEISITGILAELEVMQKELDKIERFASEVTEKSKMSKASADNLLASVKEFVSRYREQFHELDKRGQEMDETYRDLLSQFGEPRSTDSEDFFSTIAKFINQFKKISLELYPPSKPTQRIVKDIEECKPGGVEDTDAVSTIKPSLDNVCPIKDTIQKKPLSNNSPSLAPNKSSLTRTVRSVKLKPKDGFLEKQTKDGRRWQKRFFELEAGKLHYYESKGGKYSDTIRLTSTTPVNIGSDKRIIEIRTEARVWCLRAESEVSASEWFSTLKTHSQGTNR